MKFSLIHVDQIYDYTPILIVGDDGGFCDYLLWYSFNSVNYLIIKAFQFKNLCDSRQKE